jgi:hypothetical protein
VVKTLDRIVSGRNHRECAVELGEIACLDEHLEPLVAPRPSLLRSSRQLSISPSAWSRPRYLSSAAVNSRSRTPGRRLTLSS